MHSVFAFFLSTSKNQNSVNIKTLIPQHKSDFETVEKLKKYSFEEIEPIIPELLEWLQDGNWPISKEIAGFLIQFSEQISNELVKILKGDDEIWKYWILFTFRKSIKNQLYLNEIERIIQNPTQSEIENDIFEMVKKISTN